MPQARLGSNPEDRALREWIQRSVGGISRAPTGTLKQFGYDLFEGAGVSFAPESSIPVPAEYVLGPGDELRIQYYGRRNDSLSLVVDRDGVVELPDVGEIALAGMRFDQAKAELSRRIRKTLTGVTASITMGRLRSILVFVLGDARRPGSYLVGGLSTVSNALFAAGGVSKRGSLRHVLLRRGGKTVRDMDLYALLLKGDRSHDMRLLPGDVVFIPPIGKTVAVAGEVVRPGIYEIRNERSVRDVLKLAGGALPTADASHAKLERILLTGGRTVRDVNVRKRRPATVRNGDILWLPPVFGDHERMVMLMGQVKRPGPYGYKKGMRLGDLIHSRDDLTRDAFLDYVLIQRTNLETGRLDFLRAPLRKLLEGSDPKANIPLQARDRVFVLARSAIRPLKSVYVSGEVVNPGQYPLSDGMRLVDLLLAAGGPTERAYLQTAEITRYRVVNGEKRKSEHFLVHLAAAMAGDAKANIELQPDDVLAVRPISNWRVAEHVEIKGEVKFPGSYAIEDGERLSSLIERAGGFTDEAYLPAAVFTRESIRKEQQQQLQKMARQLSAEVARLQASAANVQDPKLAAQQQAAVAQAQQMLEQLQQAQASGRLVIHLTDLKKLKGSEFDLRLRDGDTLYIPKRPDEVLVMGQVYNPTALLYRKRMDVEDYIERAGGYTRFADEDHVYVVHASGEVEPVRGGWRRTRVMPGDAIVVPEDLEQFNLVDSALNWSKVLYQIGVALASMKTIGIL